jgi:hypothetical protein
VLQKFEIPQNAAQPVRFVREQFYLAATVQNLKRLVRLLTCKTAEEIALRDRGMKKEEASNASWQYRTVRANPKFFNGLTCLRQLRKRRRASKVTFRCGIKALVLG